jgi:hypothetical protein
MNLHERIPHTNELGSGVSITDYRAGEEKTRKFKIASSHPTLKTSVAAVSDFHAPNAPAGGEQNQRRYDQQSRN